MIRLATQEDILNILAVYKTARAFMKITGNPTQWGNNYPNKEILEEDIFLKRLYVFEEENEIVGAFVYFVGDEPTYEIIDGAWRDNSSYGVIHRVANSGKIKGLVKKIVDFTNNEHLRIDTHEDNKVMQHVLQKIGFYRCGIIKLEDGQDRIAYEKSSLI
ncbi:MAG: N-acetyltransferase [Clostridiales bacterium]|nr:N-acetyltransferase [Clostridiales bacterium]